MEKGKIILTDEAIYFANTGRPFTRVDFIALSLAFSSAKDEVNVPEDDFGHIKCDQKWCDKQNENLLSVYRSQKNGLRQMPMRKKVRKSFIREDGC